MKHIRFAVVILVIVLFGASAISSLAASQQNVLKVGFITVGPVSDWGYNYAHDQGRLYMQAALPGKVETIMAEKVPESAEVERVMEKMIAGGVRLIFPTSYGYFEPTLRVAQRHPEVRFECCGRTVSADIKNIATYFPKQYEPMYVAGIVAGRMTKKNSIGFIAAHAIPQVLQNINAFTLGARSVNPKVKVHVILTNNWSDPPLEAEAAKGLIESGVDILTMHLDSPITVAQVAEKYGVMTVGYHADLQKFAPKGYLTGMMWNWGPLYVQIAKSVLNNTWKPGNYRYEMKDDYAKLSPFGPKVPAKVRQEALSAVDKIKNGSLSVFQGPIIDRDGKERVAKGKTLDLSAIESMDWLVKGVEGAFKAK